jgi:hypothetical protein
LGSNQTAAHIHGPGGPSRPPSFSTSARKERPVARSSI